MKYFLPIIFLAILVYVVYPYVDLFRLDRALMADDQSELNALIDLPSVKAARKESIESQVRGATEGAGMMSKPLQEGARSMSGAAVEAMIDMNWVRDTLRWRRSGHSDTYPSIISNMSYAFFESPVKFLIRIGDLGQHPVHVRMTLKDWKWRVTAIYD
jgi:hypothetical protein